MSEAFIVETSTPERQYVKVYRDFLNSGILNGKEQIIFIQLKQYIRIGTDNGIVAGRVFPTLATLSKNVAMSEKTVREIIKKLEKKGVLEIKRQGLNKPNIYTIKDCPELWHTGTGAEESETTANNEQDVIQKIADLQALGYIVTKPGKNSTKKNNKKNQSKNAFNKFQQSNTVVNSQFEDMIISNK